MFTLFIFTSSCEDEEIFIDEGFSNKQIINKNPLDQKQKVIELAQGIRGRIIDYNDNYRKSNHFLKKYGRFDKENIRVVSFPEYGDDRLIILPFKRKKLKGKKVMIAYYKGGIKTYKILKNKKYKKKNRKNAEKAFLEKIDFIFYKPKYEDISENKNAGNEKLIINCNEYVEWIDYTLCLMGLVDPCTNQTRTIDIGEKGGGSCGSGDLDEVIVSVSNGDCPEGYEESEHGVCQPIGSDIGGGSTGSDDTLDTTDPESTEEGCDGLEFDCEYSGGSDNPVDNPCDEGQVKDKNGNCIIKPCLGNPIRNPIVAPQTNSGVKGGMYGKNRNLVNGIGTSWHYGIDIKNEYGNPIFAMYDGIARIKTQKKDGKVAGAGYYVEISSTINGQKVKILYFHMQKVNRVSGTIKAGDIIGYQGNSGNLKATIDQGLSVSHVHIKTKLNGKTVNPNIYLKTNFDTNTGEVLNQSNCN